MFISEEQFFTDISKETESARGKFLTSGAHPELDKPSRQVLLCILGEEIGKLTRAINKLSITPETISYKDVIAQWDTEGYHRIVTASATLRRLAELWDELGRK
jgi:hypothetical protein